MDNELDYDPNVPYSKQELAKRIRWQERENAHLNKSLETAQSKANALLQSNHQLEIEAERLVEEKSELQQHVNELEQAGQDRSSKVDVVQKIVEESNRLRWENEQHVKENGRLRRDNSRIAGEIVRLRTENNQKSSDEYFVKAWDGLKYSISNWAFKHFQGHPHMPQNLSRGWERAALANDVTSYLKSEKRRWLLVQSFVWRQLETRVLHRAAVLWAGQHRDALRQLLEAIGSGLEPTVGSPGNTLVAFHRWRALNAALLPAAADQKAIREAVDVGVVEPILSVLWPYASSTGTHGSPIREELLEIVLKAVALSQDFDQQRALFEVHRPNGHHGEDFDFWCDSRNLQLENGAGQDSDELFVKLVMVPGLHRFGDVDGAGGYDDEVVIAKAEVESDKSRGKKSEANLRRVPTRLRRPGQQRQQIDVKATSDDHRAVHDVPNRRPVQVVPSQTLDVTVSRRSRSIPRKSVQNQSQEQPRTEVQKDLSLSPKVDESTPTTSPGSLGPGSPNSFVSNKSNKSNRSFGERAKKLLPRKLMVDDEREKWQRKYGGMWPSG